MVICVISHFIQIVVFSRYTQAFLRIDGAYIGTISFTKKNILELIHAGVGEQQGRVISRNKRIARNNRMLFFLKKGEEFVPDLRSRFHNWKYIV